MWRAITASMLGLAACGRVGFDDVFEPDPDPALGPLTCGTSRPIAGLDAVPLGLGLASTPDGAIVAWGAGVAGDELFGLRLGIDGDEIVSADSKYATLPEPIGAFGLAGDGDARYLLSAQLPGRALLVPLDATLQAGVSSKLAGAAITDHAVAEPITAGSAFVAAWVENGEAKLSQLDATGAPTGTMYSKPAGKDIAVRRAALRDVVVWTAPGSGCAVWALDAAYVPLLPDPLVHLPADTCLRSAITRHDVGINLLAWIAGGDAHAQLGTDTNVVGAELAIGAGADELEIAVAPAGFFVAVAVGDKIGPSYVRTDATGWMALPSVPHVRGAPLRLVSHLRDALLASVGELDGVPHLWLTRLCEPGGSARPADPAGSGPPAPAARRK